MNHKPTSYCNGCMYKGGPYDTRWCYAPNGVRRMCNQDKPILNMIIPEEMRSCQNCEDAETCAGNDSEIFPCRGYRQTGDLEIIGSILN